MARPSHIRQAVEEMLDTSHKHDWSVESIADTLVHQNISASFSAVWRVLEQLEHAGSVRRVELGDNKTRYESTREHHDHVQCTSCGTVAALDGCVIEDAMRTAQRRSGFRLTEHQLVFRGLCPACVKGARA